MTDDERFEVLRAGILRAESEGHCILPAVLGRRSERCCCAIGALILDTPLYYGPLRRPRIYHAGEQLGLDALDVQQVAYGFDDVLLNRASGRGVVPGPAYQLGRRVGEWFLSRGQYHDSC